MQSPAAAPVHRAVATPDDSAVVKQIEKTHYPNGEEIDALSILNIAKGILDDCKSTPPTKTSEEGGGDSGTLTPELQFEVYRLSVQLSYKSLEAGDDVQEKTVTLFNMLSSYSWEVKVALILAAYVSSYGEYWLIAQTYRDKDQVAMGMVALLQMSDLLKDDNKKLETLFQPLQKLVNPILDLCYCIAEVKKFFLSVFASSDTRGGFPGLRATVSLETLKNKTVLLLISSTDDILSEKELPFLQEWYAKCDEVQRRQHAIILFPITRGQAKKWTDQSSMISKMFRVPNFYMVDDPRSIDPTVIRVLTEKFLINFQEGPPIVVAVGPSGRVVHPNALPMIWTWGSKAFPLTSQNEESLRNTETSKKVELLIKDLDVELLKMVKEGQKSICLFGGDNMEWILRFTSKAKQVAEHNSLEMEMFFLGKSTDSVSKMEMITPLIYSSKLVSESPKLSGAKMLSFWENLQRMLLSRAQYLSKKNTSVDDDDEVLQGLGKLVDKSGREGWAMFIKGNHIALIGDEDVSMKTLDDFIKWSGNVGRMGFEGALKDHLESLEGSPSDRPCCHLHFQHELSDAMVENIKCPECHRRLGKSTAFLCHNLMSEIA
nr:protein SIEVE ELEMENT OCCLUSION B-like [Ipomoea batatas]